jgi:FAD/FMN-containing dehydrogenase
MAATFPKTVPINALRDHLSGEVIGPSDTGYDDARRLFAGTFDKRPAAIVRPIDAEEVSRVVKLAAEAGAELAVRSGGHSSAGHSGSDGGIVLDLSAMKALDIDVESRTAWAETGLTAGEYSVAAAEHQLATGFGDTGSVGIGGLTLGGGIGYLVRRHGLTIDDLLAADIVTADGSVLRVDEQTHPDLFWAIRGGGGNFGVATRFRFRLHEVGAVYGGILMLPATVDTITGFLTEAEAAPEELSTIANVMKAPPMPFIPEELHGSLAIFALMVHSEGGDAGEQAIAPFRALAEPLADMLRPMPYPEIYMPQEEDYHPIAAGRTMFVDAVDHDVVSTILDRIQTSDAMMAVTQLRVLGGAMARVPAEATAFAHRDRRLMITVAAVVEHIEDLPAYEPWVVSLADMLRDESEAAYVNFLADEGEAGVRAAYPGGTWDRLREVKRRYDPTNLFRLNQNVPPANEEA